MRTIHQYGEEVLAQQQQDQWEGDLVVGYRKRSAIGTLVERTRGITVFLHIPDDKAASTVIDGIVQAMRQIPRLVRRSLTWY